MRDVSLKKSGKRRKSAISGGKGCLFFLAMILLVAVAFSMSGCNDLRNFIAKKQYPIKYQDIVEKYAQEFSVDKNLVYAIIRTESRFDPYAVSTAGAKGLMQLKDDTAVECSKKLKIAAEIPDDLYEPDINIKFGCYYFSVLYKQFNENLDYAIMAYNCGRGNVNKWIKEGKLNENYEIAFPETESYLSRVKNAYRIYQNIY